VCVCLCVCVCVCVCVCTVCVCVCLKRCFGAQTFPVTVAALTLHKRPYQCPQLSQGP
jgi:hypothetical protein